MITQRVVKLQLDITPKALLPTIKEYTKAVNYAAQVAFPVYPLDANIIQKMTYRTIREYLPAQLSIAAKNKAVEAVKSVRTLQKKENKRAKKLDRAPKQYRCPNSKQSCIRYDHRSYNIWFDRNQLSLLTINGRIKVNFTCPDYFKQYLSWTRRSADLVIKDNKFVFLHVVFEKDIAAPETVTDSTVANGTVINSAIKGGDRGINNPIVISDGNKSNKFYGGKHVQVVKKKYQQLRKILQSKKHSSKRHFVKINHKENRFMTDTNHCISKQVVKSLNKGDTLVIEDLTDIRDSKTKETEPVPAFRKQTNNWSFLQLETFIAYKAAYKGVNIAYVNPCYTSQECSKCGHISGINRVTQSLFVCEKCGYVIHADLNGCRVIRLRYLEARQSPNKACHQQANGYVGGVVINQPNAPGTVEQSPAFRQG